jgi:hypothetical protein
VKIVPVWNKSYREHSTIGTHPSDTRREADSAVKECGWRNSYYVDADHVGLRTVDLFMDSSDFFTVDVADFIGKNADENEVDVFVRSMRMYVSSFPIPGVQTTRRVTEEDLYAIGRRYLLAIKEAGNVYRHVKAAKGADDFVTEVSTDEANEPQNPAQLFFILGALALEGVPIQTVAPKFTGRFLKGIDYVGSVEQFTRGFEEDLLVIARAIRTFDLPRNLKLSVHSGSDKFSLYPAVHRAIIKHDAGLHVKTAGTTWLEELIGLAMSGGQGLEIAQAVYAAAYDRVDELCKPYETVIDIDRSKLPDPQKVRLWGSEEFVSALRHNRTDSRYNLHFRQLLHIAYKIAAEMGDRYTQGLAYSRKIIASNVTQNLLERHIAPIFLGPR